MPFSFHRLARAALRLPQRMLLRPALSLLRPGNVMMFHSGRSGSKVLGDLLNQHPRMFWDGEIFQNSSTVWLPLLRRKDPGRSRKAARYLCARMRLAGRSFYGAEMQFIHLKWIGMTLEEYLALLRRYGFARYVILQRRNQLRALVSELTAETTGRWHASGPGPVDLTRIRIDVGRIRKRKGSRSLPEYFAGRLEKFEMLRRHLEGEQVLSLTYEDDIEQDPRAAYDRVCRFLCLDSAPVTVNLRRTTPFPLSEVIENFDDVINALRGTPYEWMTQDGMAGGRP